tara:strand:- start:200 stop:661 length:462 start_codon:yes stop_codon:yes gene_type:complete
MLFLSKTITTLFGTGYIKYAPGTIGSILTIFIWYLIFSAFGKIYFFGLFIILTISAYYLIDKYLSIYNKKDPQEVIIDEFIGISIPLLFINSYHSYFEILLVFVSFRFFDIFKIYPVNRAEMIDGSIGIILDDVIAGIYSLIILLIFQIIIKL